MRELINLLRNISAVTDVSIEDLKSKKRHRYITDVRHVYFAMAKEIRVKSITGTHTLAKIGSVVNRDHASVLHGIKNINNVYQLQQLYNEIKSKITEYESKGYISDNYIHCCDSFEDIISKIEWFNYEDEKGKKHLVLPHVISNLGEKVKVNFCPFCGENIIGIDFVKEEQKD